MQSNDDFNDEIIKLSNMRLLKAKKDLESAKLLLDNGLVTQSINRSYYSIFHSVRALLAYDRFDSKKHSGIIAYFNQNYIKSGKIDKKYSEILMYAWSTRDKSDYDDFYNSTKDEAEIHIKNAEDFINRIKEYINLI